MTRHLIRNARIVTGEESFIGCVAVEGDTIRSVDPGATSACAAEDWTPTTWKST